MGVAVVPGADVVEVRLLLVDGWAKAGEEGSWGWQGECGGCVCELGTQGLRGTLMRGRLLLTEGRMVSMWVCSKWG